VGIIHVLALVDLVSTSRSHPAHVILWFCGFVVLWFCGFVVWSYVCEEVENTKWRKSQKLTARHTKTQNLGNSIPFTIFKVSRMMLEIEGTSRLRFSSCWGSEKDKGVGGGIKPLGF
jgi:hypothetical protein